METSNLKNNSDLEKLLEEKGDKLWVQEAIQECHRPVPAPRQQRDRPAEGRRLQRRGGDDEVQGEGLQESVRGGGEGVWGGRASWDLMINEI